MLRAAGHRLLQLKCVEQGAKAALSSPFRHSYASTISPRIWKVGSSWRAFCSPARSPATEFRGIYSTRNIDFDEQSNELWKRISKDKLKKPTDILKEWRNEGNNVLTDEVLCNIVYKLCTRNRFKHALHLTSWLKDDDNEPEDEFYKVMKLDILARVGSVEGTARPYFDKLTNKSEMAYLMILRGYSSDFMEKQAQEILEEMKKLKLMTSGRAYMFVLKMFIKAGKKEKALEIFKEFEESGLSPTSEMYWDLLEHRDTIFSSIPVMEKAEEALPKIMMEKSDRRDVLKISAVLGKREEVDRVWNEVKGLHNVAEAVAAIYSYDLLGDLEKVEEISQQMGEKGATDHCIEMLRVYARRGDIEKALEWQGKLIHKNFQHAHPLIVAYLQKGDVEKAFEVFKVYTEKEAFSQHPRALVEECVVKLNEEFAKRKDVERAEEVIGRVLNHHTVRMFESLIRVYLSADEAPKSNIRRRMEKRSLPTNGAETVELLQQLCGVPGYDEELSGIVSDIEKDDQKEAKKVKKSKDGNGENKSKAKKKKKKAKANGKGKAGENKAVVAEAENEAEKKSETKVEGEGKAKGTGKTKGGATKTKGNKEQVKGEAKKKVEKKAETEAGIEKKAETETETKEAVA